MAVTSTTLVIACALLFAVLSIVTWRRRRRRLYEQASKFSGPPDLPIIGSAARFIKHVNAIFEFLVDLTESYPSPACAWLGPQLLVAVTDPEQLKAIFMSPKITEKCYMYEFFRPLVGTGLVTAPASKWRVHRRLIQPFFNAKILDGFVDVFAAQSLNMVNKLKQNLDGPEFEVFGLVALTMIDILHETMMGLKTRAQTTRGSDYVNAAQKVGETLSARIIRPWLYPDFIFNRTQNGKDLQRATTIIQDFTDNVIATKKSELKCRSQTGREIIEDDEYERVPRRESFLDSPLKLSLDGDKWSDKELRDEVTTMMVAGYDSTAITNSYVLLMLASHPDVQEKVYQELYEIYGDADVDERPVVPEDLGRMQYMERVIKETMRLFPLLPLMGRKVMDDFEIGEYIIPKGTELFVPILQIHRSDKYWQDPLTFDPDRFLPEEIAKRHPYTYLAFSGGLRNCIGIKYALMAMKTLHATILRRYILKKDKIIPVKDIRLKVETVVKPIDPIALRIEMRTRNN